MSLRYTFGDLSCQYALSQPVYCFAQNVKIAVCDDVHMQQLLVKRCAGPDNR